jgi:hypothetical protein
MGGAASTEPQQRGQRPSPQPSPRARRYDIHTSLPAGGRIGPPPSSRFAVAPLRFAPSGDGAGPMRRFASMVFAERSRPAGRLVSPKTMETKSLSRAQGSRLARTRDPRSGLGQRASEGTPVFRGAVDAEHGSGTADQDDFELRCVNPPAARAVTGLRVPQQGGTHLERAALAWNRLPPTPLVPRRREAASKDAPERATAGAFWSILRGPRWREGASG